MQHKVSIPKPQQIPKGKGIHSTYGVAPLMSRISKLEHNQIEQACDKLGISKSAFVRWCAVKVAEEINKDRRKV